MKPYVAHATFQFSGSVGKRHRFRESRLWYDDARYFSPESQGFLSYSPYVPEDMLKQRLPPYPTHKDSHLVTAHFKLANLQLTQVRR